MTDVLSCDECGSRRLSAAEQGYLCNDCGHYRLEDFEFGSLGGACLGGDHWSFGGPDDGSNAAFGSHFDPRFDGERFQVSGVRSQPGEDPDPDPSELKPETGAPGVFRDDGVVGTRNLKPLFTDAHSRWRCACCFQLAARCRRTVHLTGRQRCCVGCHCSEG